MAGNLQELEEFGPFALVVKHIVDTFSLQLVHVFVGAVFKKPLADGLDSLVLLEVVLVEGVFLDLGGGCVGVAGVDGRVLVDEGG